MSGALSPAAALAVLAVCLTASAFFSGAETGLMSISRIRLRTLLRRQPHPGAAALRRLLARIEDPVLTCLIGTNLANVGFSAVLTAALATRYGNRGEFAAAAIAAVLVIVFGEIIPKVVYREFPERLSLASVRPLRAVMLLLAPARWVLLAYSSLLDRLLPGRGRRAEGAVIGREAMHQLMAAHPAAAQDGRFTELLARCLALSDLNLDAVMTPWARVDSLPRSGPRDLPPPRGRVRLQPAAGAGRRPARGAGLGAGARPAAVRDDAAGLATHPGHPAAHLPPRRSRDVALGAVRGDALAAPADGRGGGRRREPPGHGHVGGPAGGAGRQHRG
ncbi:MAG: DUF21 domain-containing protein [bacterium]|nr:DUF21 domain-containing protein [bacterium]